MKLSLGQDVYEQYFEETSQDEASQSEASQDEASQDEVSLESPDPVPFLESFHYSEILCDRQITDLKMYKKHKEALIFGLLRHFVDYFSNDREVTFQL